MNTSTRSIEAEAELTEVTEAYVTMFNKGLERVVELSKTSLDFAVDQNTEVMASCTRALKSTAMPGIYLFDLAGRAFESYVTLQKNLLDLAVEQSKAIIEGAQEYSNDDGKAKVGITNNLIRQSVDRTVAAQKLVLDLESKQGKAVSDTIKQQSGANGRAR